LGAHLPLAAVADVPLPGGAVRFDYQDLDVPHQHLVIAHMDAGEVLIVNLTDGSIAQRLTGIPTARGVVVADNVNRIFVTSSPNQVVVIDAGGLKEVRRVTTGNAPDGIGWDPADKIVGVSDQGDGALSLIADSGNGARTSIPLGVETGNVVYDASRGRFWITVVKASPPGELVAVDPMAAKVTSTIPLPGCDGAHGLRLHPDGQSAFVACEGNDVLVRADLVGAQVTGTAATGSGPDVMSIDAGLGWLYVAAESGDLTLFDINKPGTALIGHDNPGANSHSVAVDPATHRVFFPLISGPSLRIMRPGGLAG
jgi:YVTN family beta-propeller protein